MELAPRVATDADDPQLRRLAREVAMVGPLSYSLEREPAFFRFPRLQGDEVHTLVVDSPARDQIVAMGTGVVGARTVGGRRRRVLYLSDLKVAPDWRRRGAAAQLFAAALARLPELGVELSYGLGLGGNRAMEAG